MSRARIDKIRIRVRGPLDRDAARRLGADIARALPAHLGAVSEPPAAIAIRVTDGAGLADRVAAAIGTAIGTAKEPR